MQGYRWNELYTVVFSQFLDCLNLVGAEPLTCS